MDQQRSPSVAASAASIAEFMHWRVRLREGEDYNLQVGVPAKSQMQAVWNASDLGGVAFDTTATRMQAHKFTERRTDFEDGVRYNLFILARLTQEMHHALWPGIDVPLALYFSSGLKRYPSAFYQTSMVTAGMPCCFKTTKRDLARQLSTLIAAEGRSTSETNLSWCGVRWLTTCARLGST